MGKRLIKSEYISYMAYNYIETKGRMKCNILIQRFLNNSNLKSNYSSGLLENFTLVTHETFCMCIGISFFDINSIRIKQEDFLNYGLT